LNAFLKNQGANVSEDKFNNLFNRLENVPKDLLEEARKEIKSKDELLKAAREAERKGKKVKQSSEPRHPTSKPQEGYTELMNLLVVDMKLDELKARDAAYFLLEAYRVYLGTINKTPDKTGGKKQPQKKSPVSKTVDMATTLKTSDDVIEQIIVIVGEKSGAIKQEKKISSKAIGTAETIAAHGFINLPSELIAALVGSEGGGLKWLGSVFSGTKDFMHFELEKCDLSVPSTQTTLPE